MDDTLFRELWTSWASLLRSYAAMHGMNSTHHAVVEVSADSILLRVDTRWLRFTVDRMECSDGGSAPFALFENGTAQTDADPESMDLLAERLTRELLHPA